LNYLENNKIIFKGAVVFKEEDINKALSDLGETKGYAVKAQVHTGGRGLGFFKENNFQGGVQVVSTPQQVKEVIPKMVGKTLVTKQTGENGLPCQCIFIVEKLGNY
jgi:succinyl-CoA synthetase beta subunit